MNDINLFSMEERNIFVAEELLRSDKTELKALRRSYWDLLGHYKKMLRQLKRLIKLSDRQQQKLNEHAELLERENLGLALELGYAFESFIRTLTTTIDAKHRLTAGHSGRVTEYGLFLGKILGLSKQELEVLKYAGLLHDIGKIGIPDAILTKKGRFDPEERIIMNRHAEWTFKIIEEMHLPNELKGVPKMAACHHEKLDGTGYPYQLKGEAIPFNARILAVSDVFDALTSPRDYPKYDQGQTYTTAPFDHDRVFSILERGKGNHFDPEIVDTLFDHESELIELHNHLIYKDFVVGGSE